MQKWKLWSLALIALLGVSPNISAGEDGNDINIVTWNAREIFSTADVQERADDFKKLYKELHPEILILQEITSCEELDEIKKVVGVTEYDTVCSDFNPDNYDRYASFEVGIISKYPITEALEFDQSVDQGTDTSAEEYRLQPSPQVNVSSVHVGRGFLNARIDSLKIIINAVHLKSSRGKVGQRDKENAEKREYVIASLASNMVDQLTAFPDYTYVVAGDFNVGHSDTKKNGVTLLQDCYSHCNNSDGYDDTHALLATELVSGIEMTNLTLSHHTSTYPRYPGSPIDNIYAQGPLLEKFSEVKIGTETYGSDHLPVLVTVTLGNEETKPDGNDNELRGQAFREYLRKTWFEGKHKSLSYNEARMEMYSNVDSADDAYVYGVYTGYRQKAKLTTFLDPINAEHTVPQSWFDKKVPMKSDIHHLFPTHKDPNTRRGTLPFGEIKTPTVWLGLSDGKYVKVGSLPARNEESYSELLKGTMFEPPENQKGNTARAIAYFYTMYPTQAGSIDRIFYRNNIQLLADWHKADPVDDAERKRNTRIKKVQGNSNPYIEHPEWLCRAWELQGCQ